MRYSPEGQGFNSTTRLHSRGSSVRRFFTRAAMIAGLALGGNLAQPAVRTAQAQESKGNIKQVQQLLEEVAKYLKAIMDDIDSMKASGMSPASVTYSDPNVKKLLSALERLNTALKPFNGNVPVSGTTDKKKFESVNIWLGRPKEAPIDSDAMKKLEMEVMLAGASISSSAIAAGVAGTPPVVSTSAIPSRTIAEPSRTEVVPARVDYYPEYEQVIENLQIVADHGRNQTVRTSAKAHLDKINAELAKGPEADSARLQKFGTEAQKLLDQKSDGKTNLQKAQERRSQGAESSSFTQFQPETAGAQEAGDIVSSLTPLIQGSSAPNKKDKANHAINLVGDSWLLGEVPRVQMLEHLKKARDAILADDFTTADTHMKKAEAVFAKEQKLIRDRLTQVVVPLARSALDVIGTEANPKLPTGAELRAEERADKTKYYDVPIMDGDGKVRRHVKTGHEDLKKKMQERFDRVSGLSGSPKLSYYEVESHYRAVTREEAVLRTIVDLWSFYQDNKDSGKGDKVKIWNQYVNAVIAVLDPNIPVFYNYPKSSRESLARIYFRMNMGRTPTQKEIEDTERALGSIISRSHVYRYDDAVHNLYDAISDTIPDISPGLKQPAERVATLRTIRTVGFLSYEVYRRGGRSTVSGYDFLTDAELQSPERLELTKVFLENTIAASGLAPDDPLVKHANAWLKRAKGAQGDKIPYYSDAIYYLAMSISSIVEAETWRANPEMRRNLNDAALQEVDATIAQARRVCYWNFGDSRVRTTWHPNLAISIADHAVKILAPRALETTEVAGVGVTLKVYDDEVYKLTDGGAREPTSAEVSQAIAIAAAAETRYVSFLTQVRSNPNFAVSEYQRTDLTSRRNSQLLHFGVGRTDARPVTARVTSLRSFPAMEGILEKPKLTDRASEIHFVPHDQAHMEISSLEYEDYSLREWGKLYVEVYRMAIMGAATHSTPKLLQSFNFGPYNDRMLKAAQRYAEGDPKAVLEELNLIYIDMLTEKIEKLAERLEGDITLVSGNTFKRKELVDSPHYNARLVKRAQWALRDLRRIRADLIAHKRGNLFARPVDPDSAIRVAEIAIESLADEHPDGGLKPLPDPPVKKPAALDDVAFSVPSTSIDIGRYSSFGNQRRVRFTARDVSVTVVKGKDKGKKMTLEQYQRAQGYTVNLTHYWFAYQFLGRRDSNGQEILYLRNPDYDPNSKQEHRRNMYVGQIVRGATYTDGTSAGDVVVRVRRSTSSDARHPEWVPLYQDSQGRIRKEDVLYRLESGTREPIRDDLLNTHLREAAIQTRTNQTNVGENGDAYPTVILYPHSTTPMKK